MLSPTQLAANLQQVPLNRPFMPVYSRYLHYLQKMYDSKWLTNNGPLVQELSERLNDYLGVKNLILTSNGTAALQLAYRAFELKGNVITTPFSFVATSGSLDWVGLKPKFADIDNKTLNISPANINKCIDRKTSAILPVHVYGNPCDTKEIEEIGQKNKLKVIYDACHAFGVKRNSASILKAGDASALSFHSTKLFHTIEGGALVVNDDEYYERARKMINFGIEPDGSIGSSGFNGKMSEAHAAMGLAMLESIDLIIEKRQLLFSLYQKTLKDYVEFPTWDDEASKNGSYFPILLKNEALTLRVFKKLSEQNIQARRYFYPSLNTIPSFKNNLNTICPNAERAAKRVLCLPLFFDLTAEEVLLVCESVKVALT
jgi:dTDP-4-amino-4,6-dideoxygalactose transaminase